MPAAKLTKRQFLGLGASALAATAWANHRSNRAFAASGAEKRTRYSASYSDRAIKLVSESLVIDLLSILDMGRLHTALAGGDDPLKFTHEELLAIKESGINVFYPAGEILDPDARTKAMGFLAIYNGLIAEHPDLLMRIDSSEDFDELQSSGKTGIILGTQSADHFVEVGDVKNYYYAGQRISQLTYNSQNRIGSGSTERVDGGISDFGEQIIHEMNRLGMAVDVSHAGPQTILDAFELSHRPVLVSHSNCQALVPGHPRCMTDEAIRKMAAQGGVMGITAVRNFVRDREPTTIEHYIDHIDHVVNLVGIEHVGIGLDSDLNGYDDLPPALSAAMRGSYKPEYAFRDKSDIEGLDHPQKIYDLTEALVRGGYSDENIRLILGENFRRVLSEVWTS